MSDIITEDVIALLRDESPEDFTNDDSSWIDEAVSEVGTLVGPDVFSVLADRLASSFVAVRAYHACRPDSPGTILSEGLHVPDSAWILAQARRVFHVPDDLILRTIGSSEIASRTGAIYFGLDELHLLKYCGHYLIHGSEVLQAAAASLGQLTGRDFFHDLRSRGIPTVFVCDVPLEAIQSSDRRELAGVALSSHLASLVTGSRVASWIDFSLTLRQAIPADWLVDHYHPTAIPNPHDGFQIYKSERSSCEGCTTASSVKGRVRGELGTRRAKRSTTRRGARSC